MIAQQKAHPAKDPQTFLQDPSAFWNKFYTEHKNKFFKDRNWFSREFPELLDASHSLRVLELGCGVGNSFFPLLASNPGAFVLACDFSREAIDVLQSHPQYDESRGRAFCHDITQPFEASIVPPASIDVATAIFVMSAIDPALHVEAWRNVRRVMKTGGVLLYRDYAPYDLTQLRFKHDRMLRDGLYRRGDGTLVAFVAVDAVCAAAEAAGFVVREKMVDHRLLVNRGRRVKMHRVWNQIKFVAQ